MNWKIIEIMVNNISFIGYNGMTKIYVLKWSEIFDEFSKRHEYLLDKLNLEEELWLKQHDNADNVVDNIVYNSATLEKPLIPKKSK